MAARIRLLLLLVAVVTGDCPPSKLKYGLSDCSQQGERTASFYWEGCIDPLPQPITGLKCDLECPAGSFLGLNTENQQSECQQCPENTFSEGGATYFLPGMWNEFEQVFHSRCYMSYGKRINVSGTCPRWDATEGGRYLMTGEGVDEIWYESILESNFHLAKRGKLSLRYRKISAWLHSIHTGVFAVMIRGDLGLLNYTDSEQTSEWREVAQVLEPGDYNVIISYKFLFIAEANTRSEIQTFTISGTALADLSCMDCPSGFFSRPGVATCYQCPMNSYYDARVKGCSACGPNMYSPAASVGVSSCKQRQKCSAHDFTATFTPCKAGSRTKTFEWIQPQICDKEGAIQLPDDQIVPCELCLPGHYHAQVAKDESACRPCPDGYYSMSLSQNDTCQTCPAGNFAAKALNYTVWSPFPIELSNECRTSRGEQCAFSTGWISSLFTLTSGTMHEQELELVLTRYVNIIHQSAIVSFAYTLEAGSQGGRLEFLINNRITKEYKADVAVGQSGEIPLQMGYQKLTWVYYHPGSGSDIAYIHFIAIQGSDEGGANSCLPCSAGYWSSEASTICQPCPPGHSAAPGSSQCVACSELEYSPVAGGQCMKCPENSKSNLARTACEFAGMLVFNQTDIPIWELAKASSSPVLCTSAQSKLFCEGSFYGPVFSPKGGNKYYVSILNPQKLELVDYVSIDRLPYGYAYAVMNHSLVSFSSASATNKEFFCLQEEEQVLVNLGSRIDSIRYEGAVSIAYTSGDVCSKNGRTFASGITLACDSRQRDGWPTIASESDCLVSFQWTTRYACPACSKSQAIVSKSACVNGRRRILVSEPPSCVLVEVITDSWEDCNEVIEILGRWQTYVALGVIVLVFGATLVLVYCYCNMKKRYARLVELKQPK